jgi:hypothetical protein
MHSCSNTSNALGNGPGFPGITTLEDQFNAAEHGAGAPSIGYHTIFNLNFDPQVTFNPGNWIYD